MPPDARKLTDWLQSRTGTTRELLAHSDHLAQVNQELRTWLNEPWADAVRLARLDDGTAVFYADNASVSTLLRYRGPAILAHLRERHQAVCTELQIKVRPAT